MQEHIQREGRRKSPRFGVGIAPSRTEVDTLPSEPPASVITPEQIERGIRLGNIFMPHAARHRRALFDDERRDIPARMVHYTTAEAALNIIRSKRFWMRNTNCMADYREVQHGFDIVQSFFSDVSKQKAFTEALDACAEGAASEAIQLFVNSWNDTRFNTYISSLSEHLPEENVHGRLSMWRGFGGNAPRVGIVLNIPWYSVGAIAMHLLFSPVAYLSEADAHRVWDEVIENIRTNRAFLRETDRLTIINIVFMTLLVEVVCLKHEGFHEEREWRAIYHPKRWPSELMESSTEVIAGAPQIVYKIPLDLTASEALADLEFSRIFDRLIVGPTVYPWPMYEAFTEALKKAGVADAADRVITSRIPIRA